MKPVITALIRSLPVALLAAAFVAAPLSGRAAGQCDFTGIDTASFGTGTGVCSSSTLLAALDTATCDVTFSYAADEFHCGNTYFTQQLLILGLESFPVGIPVSAKFLPDSRLYVNPLFVFGPLPGGSVTLSVPNDAALLGLTFYAQTAPTFITTVSFPIKPETGLSSALALTLH